MNNTPDQIDLTPGQIIMSAREAMQISVADIAERLMLGKQILVALEDDDYSRISAQVYAEGYLKAYAKFLQISPDLLIQSFRNSGFYSDNEIQKSHKSSVKDDSKMAVWLQSQRARLIASGVFVILFLAGSGFFLFNFMYKGKVDKVSIAAEGAIATEVDGSSSELTTVVSDVKDEQGFANIDIPLEIRQSKDLTKKR